MKLVYAGQYAEVVVPMPGRGESYVAQGGILDTSVEHGASLLEQPSNWIAYVPMANKNSKAVTAVEKTEDTPANAAEPTNSEQEIN